MSTIAASQMMELPGLASLPSPLEECVTTWRSYVAGSRSSSSLPLSLAIVRGESTHLSEVLRAVSAEHTSSRPLQRLFDLSSAFVDLLEQADPACSAAPSSGETEAPSIQSGVEAILSALANEDAMLSQVRLSKSLHDPNVSAEQYMNDMVTLRAQCDRREGLLSRVGSVCDDLLHWTDPARGLVQRPVIHLLLRVVPVSWMAFSLASLACLNAGALTPHRASIG